MAQASPADTDKSKVLTSIDDLLSLSRIELRAHVTPQGPADLAAIVRQVLDGLQTLARERDVKLILEAPTEPIVVRGDLDELTRLFECPLV